MILNCLSKKKLLPKCFMITLIQAHILGKLMKTMKMILRKIKLKQRVGINIKNRNLKTDNFGRSYNLPLGLAPVGMGGMMYPDGEVVVAKVASEMNIPYVLSTMSICSIEQVAMHSKNNLWFQLYVMKDKEFVKNIISRAKKAKCQALVITMDLPILAQRHNDIRNGLSAPPSLELSKFYN